MLWNVLGCSFQLDKRRYLKSASVRSNFDGVSTGFDSVVAFIAIEWMIIYFGVSHLRSIKIDLDVR